MAPRFSQVDECGGLLECLTSPFHFSLLHVNQADGISTPHFGHSDNPSSATQVMYHVSQTFQLVIKNLVGSPNKYGDDKNVLESLIN